jgi:hypothetical protein
MYTYSPGSYASNRAFKWLKNSMVRRNTPQNVATQMEEFAILGCSEGLKMTQDGVSQFLILQYLTLTYYDSPYKNTAELSVKWMSGHHSEGPWYSGLQKHCNVLQFQIVCSVVLYGMEITLSIIKI